MSELFNHVPRQLESGPGVSTHVICGNVVQESSTPFTAGSENTAGLQVSSTECKQAVCYTRLKQKPCVAGRDPGPAPDNREATPPPPAVARHACDREPADTLPSTGESAGKPTSAQARNEAPPLLVSVEHGAASVVVHMCGRRQEIRNRYPNRSLVSSSGGLNHPSPNAGSRSTTAAACDDCVVINMNVSCARCPSNDTITVRFHCRPSANDTTANPVPSEPLQDPTLSTSKAPLDWTLDDVVQWIRMMPQCAPYAEMFRREEIDGRALLLLQMEHLVVHLALPAGPAAKIFEAICELRGNRRL